MSTSLFLFHTGNLSAYDALLLGSLVLIYFALVRIYRLLTALPLPPGPKHTSVWGTYYERPSATEPWKTYKKWARQYASSLIYYKLRGRQVIIINSFQAAFELLDKRSLNYSSRPDFPMMDLIGRQDNVGFQRYGQRLKKCRKLLHDALNVRSVVKWESLVDTVSISLLEDLLLYPNDVERPTQRFVGALIVRFTYGQVPDHEYLHYAKETAKHSSEAMIPGKWLIDTFPFLRYLPAWAPGGGFHIWAAEARKTFRDFTQIPFQKVKREVESGSDTSSFVHDNLSDAQERLADHESIIAGTAASLYAAATDTTASVLLTFFLMMTVRPDVQERAFREISSVVGNDRLPSLQDRTTLPYIEALIQELHRFNPPVPLMPRSPEQEDVYEGSTIPRKTWMFTNIWAMTHDENEYTDPDLFNPDRFMAKDQSLRDPRTITFGFGRRACPGNHFANAAIFLAITRILAVFRIEPEKDEKGQPLLPAVEFVTAFVSAPKPFGCTVVPRSTELVDLIKQARGI